MARHQITAVVTESIAGTRVQRSVAGATVQIYKRGTTTTPSIYAAETGGSALTAPFTSDDSGRVIDEAAAKLWVAPQPLDIVATLGGFTYTQAYEADVSELWVEPNGGDDTANIQAALDSVVGLVPITVRLRDALYTITGAGLSVDASQNSLVGGRGTMINATAITSGTAILVMATSNAYEGNNSFSGAGCRIENIRLLGGVNIDANPPNYLSMGIVIDAADALSDAAHISFQNVFVRGFSYGVRVQDNAHQINFNDCWATYNVIGLDCPYGSTNSGERITWKGGMFAQNCIHVSNGAADIHFYGVSLDYTDPGGRLDTTGGLPLNAKRRAIAQTQGRFFMHGGHIEDSNDEDWWITTGDANSAVILSGVQLHLGGNKTAYKMFRCNNDGSLHNPNYGGIVLRDCHLHISSGFSYSLSSLVEGAGRVVCEGLTVEYDATIPLTPSQPAVASSLSVVDGTFDTAPAVAQWNLTGSTAGNAPVLDAATKRTGAGAIKFEGLTAASGLVSEARLAIPVRPGQMLLSNFYRKLTNNDATHYLSYALTVKNAQGVLITAHNRTVGWTADLDWTLYQAEPYLIAPGAATLEVTFYTTNYGTTLASKAWIDDLVLNLV